MALEKCERPAPRRGRFTAAHTAAPFWTSEGGKKPLAPPGIRNPDRPARSLVPTVTELPRLSSALRTTHDAVLSVLPVR